MGLSTRILLRIVLPSAALLAGTGAMYHFAMQAQQTTAAQQRLQSAAAATAELIGSRAREVEERLSESMSEVGVNLGELPTQAAQLFAHDRQLVRFEVHAADGRGLASFSRDGQQPLPAPADARWLAPALANGRHVIQVDGPANVVRFSCAVPARDGAPQLVASGLIDFDLVCRAAIVATSQGLGQVSVVVHFDEGRPLRIGPPLDVATLLSVSAPAEDLGGRVTFMQSREQVLAGLIGFERDALLVCVLLIAAVALLLWTGMRSVVLKPVRALRDAVRAFENDKPIPPPPRGAHPTGELAELDAGLRKVFEEMADSHNRLRDLNNTLEVRVRERTLELEHNANALRAARDEARAANEAKSEFVANVSHEVRTPLNAILGMTGMLLETELSEDQHESVATVRNAGENLLSLINHILDFSKMEAGRLELETLDFELESVTRGVTDLLGPSATQKGLRLDTEIAPAAPSMLRGDPSRLRQVLVNLVGNAIKFTQEGAITLRVELDRDRALWREGARDQAAQASPEGAAPGADGTVFLRFEVRDTGIGLPPGSVPRLFEPFTQADGSTTRRFGGTGLGLAICKQIVERMGGMIGAESAPGQGSCFWFRVPFHLQQQHEIMGPRQNLRWELSGLHVLVASSQAGSRRFVEQSLTSCGTRTESVGTSEAALTQAQDAFARSQPFHAALIDENLGGAGADALARALRADPALARTPLLLMTRAELAQSPLSAEYTLRLVKPLNTAHLIEALCAAVTGAAQATPAAATRASTTTPETPTRVPTAAVAAAPVTSGLTPDAKPAARGAQPAPVAAAVPATAVTAAAAAPASPTAIHRTTAAAPAEDATAPLRRCILLAEDNPVNQRVAARLLERLGFEVDVVGDGAQAVASVARRRYDAVLMDLQMPVMDGYEATRRIRQSAQGGRQLPIIALTAHAMTGDRERALAGGLDDYVCKPVRPTDLAAVLDRCLGSGAPLIPVPPAESRT